MSVLTDDERRRAERYRFEQDRERFITARATLRHVLAAYLNAKPQDVVFRYGATAKPYLGGAHKGLSLQFNISRSHNLGLFAVARGRAVGVDVEQIHRDQPMPETVRSFFSPTEQAVLASLPPTMQLKAFYLCWARKEAFLKARGDGLTVDPSSFDVVCSDDLTVALQTSWDPLEAQRWMLRDLTACDEYAAAVAATGRDWVIRCGEWQF